MLKKLLPVVLLLVGSGAGVGAGVYLRPAPVLTEVDIDHHEELAEGQGGSHADHETGANARPANEHDNAHDNRHGDGSGVEYVKLNNQFVVPIVKDQNVAALVVLALSLEVPEGSKDDVYRREPKVRDSFLQVLFDHANVGGFDGAFTEAGMLKNLRVALREVAQRDLGQKAVNDVLILEIARQDY